LLGVDRFVLGSDYPVGGPANPVADITSLGLTPDDEAAILRENAATSWTGHDIVCAGPARLVCARFVFCSGCN
jgi:hypothetical protein